MSLVHTSSSDGAGGWRTTKYWWAYVSAWELVQEGYVWDSLAWQHIFTMQPGPLAYIDILPINPTVPQLTQCQFYAYGYDADGRGVAITPTWTCSTITDSIDSSGLFSAGSTPSSPIITAYVGAITGYGSADVP